MQIQLKKWLEPIGLFLLIGAFIWHNYSYYHANVVRDEQLYRIEEAAIWLLGCACDEAMKDSNRYNGETSIYENGELSAEAAIVQLKTHVLFNQVSFHTQSAISHLKFLESVEV